MNKIRVKKKIVLLLMVVLIMVPTVVYADEPFFDTTSWIIESNKAAYKETNATYQPASFSFGLVVPNRAYKGERASGSDTEGRHVSSTNISGVDYPGNDGSGTYENKGLNQPMELDFVSNLMATTNHAIELPLYLYGLLMKINYMDVSAISEVFNGQFKDTLEGIFLQNDEGLSAFMVVFILMWMIGAVGLAFNIVRGKGSSSSLQLFKEIGIIILSMFLFMAAPNLDNLSSALVSLETSITSSVIETSTGNASNTIWSGESDDVSCQNYMNTYGSITGYLIESQLKEIFDSDDLSEFDTDSEFVVEVGNGITTVHNYAYAYYAGASLYDYATPFKDGEFVLSDYSDNEAVKMLIHAIDNDSSIDDNAKERFYNGCIDPSYSSFLNFIEVLAIMFSYVHLTLISLLMKVIIGCLFLIGYVLPGLILWNKTRDLAKDLTKILLFSIILEVIFSVLSLILEVLLTVGFSGDISTNLIIIAILVILAFKMPELIKKIIIVVLRNIRINNPTVKSFVVNSGNKIAKLDEDISNIESGVAKGLAISPFVFAGRAAANAIDMLRNRGTSEDDNTDNTDNATNTNSTTDNTNTGGADSTTENNGVSDVTDNTDADNTTPTSDSTDEIDSVDVPNSTDETDSTDFADDDTIVDDVTDEDVSDDTDVNETDSTDTTDSVDVTDEDVSDDTDVNETDSTNTTDSADVFSSDDASDNVDSIDIEEDIKSDDEESDTTISGDSDTQKNLNDIDFKINSDAVKSVDAEAESNNSDSELNHIVLDINDL